ncbi:PDZ domain-containing protein [bacterium]|nr:PDZ domain-containing protein [bacterium]
MNTRKISALSIFLILAITLSACSTSPAKATLPATTEVAQTEQPQQSEPAATDANPVIGSLSSYQAALEEIYTKVNPSVVNIQVIEKAQVASNTTTENPFANIPGFEFYFGSPSTPNQQSPSQPTQALGSGFVWNKDGYIVTNNHVVANADKIQVTFSDGTIANAKLVGTDVNSDLAIIQLEDYTGTLYPITSSESTNVKVGQVAIAIGNPYGLENTMTVGIVSAVGRSLPTDQTAATSYTIPDIIQTDAPINPGNSGGVLVNDQGHLIGVTAAIESSTGANAGIGFAIPSSTVNKVIPALIKDGKYEHAYLGLTGTTLTPDLAEAMDLDANQRGVLVIAVANDGPADKAGLMGSSKTVTLNGIVTQVGGDIITAIDGKQLNAMDDLISYLASHTEVGQSVKLTILRNGSEKTLDATVLARPEVVEQTLNQTNPSTNNNPSSSAWMGVAVTPMTADIAREMGLPTDQKGLLLQQVVAGGPADLAGLIGSYKPVIINSKRVMIGGDVITSIENQTITTVDDLQQALAAKVPGDQVQLTVIRSDTELTVSVTLAEKPAS